MKQVFPGKGRINCVKCCSDNGEDRELTTRLELLTTAWEHVSMLVGLGRKGSRCGELREKTEQRKQVHPPPSVRSKFLELENLQCLVLYIILGQHFSVGHVNGILGRNILDGMRLACALRES